MGRIIKGIITLVTIIGAAGAANAMELHSNVIKDGKLALAQACARQGGQDISPDLQIKDIPPEAQYLAIIMDDPDAMPVAGKIWVHWNVLNIPATVSSIQAGAHVTGDTLANSGGNQRYGGMCPPDREHTYRIAVFALKGPVIDTHNARELTIEEMEQRYRDRILDKAIVLGKFSPHS